MMKLQFILLVLALGVDFSESQCKGRGSSCGSVLFVPIGSCCSGLECKRTGGGSTSSTCEPTAPTPSPCDLGGQRCSESSDCCQTIPTDCFNSGSALLPPICVPNPPEAVCTKANGTCVHFIQCCRPGQGGIADCQKSEGALTGTCVHLPDSPNCIKLHDGECKEAKDCCHDEEYAYCLQGVCTAALQVL